jgi:hypothetical protein
MVVGGAAGSVGLGYAGGSPPLYLVTMKPKACRRWVDLDAARIPQTVLMRNSVSLVYWDLTFSYRLGSRDVDRRYKELGEVYGQKGSIDVCRGSSSGSFASLRMTARTSNGNSRSLRDDKQKNKQLRLQREARTRNGNSRSLRDDKQKNKQLRLQREARTRNGNSRSLRDDKQENKQLQLQREARTCNGKYNVGFFASARDDSKNRQRRQQIPAG